MWNLLLGNNILWGKDLSLMWITVEKIRKTFHEKNFNLFSSSWHLEEKYTDKFGVALSHHLSRLSYFFFFYRIIRIIIIILILTPLFFWSWSTGWYCVRSWMSDSVYNVLLLPPPQYNSIQNCLIFFARQIRFPFAIKTFVCISFYQWGNAVVCILMHGKYKIVFSYNGNLTMAMVIVFMKTRPQQTFKGIVRLAVVNVSRLGTQLCGVLGCNDHYAMV